MILDGFRKANLRKNIKKELLKNNSLNNSSNKKVDSILILVDESSKENLEQDISSKFNIDVSNVASVILKTKQGSESNFKNELTEKDFSLFGKLKNDEIEKLVQSEFDLLLNYVDDNQFLNYITVFSKSKFKVGFKTNQKQLFDLEIAIEQNNVELFHVELMKYLKILNKI